MNPVLLSQSQLQDKPRSLFSQTFYIFLTSILSQMLHFRHNIFCSKLEAEQQSAQPTECRGLLPQGTLNEGEYTIMISD
jgi:hypothetical protein